MRNVSTVHIWVAKPPFGYASGLTGADPAAWFPSGRRVLKVIADVKAGKIMAQRR